MTRIEPPPDIVPELTYDHPLSAACRTLQNVQGSRGAVALMDAERFEAWRAAVRIHRDAWKRYIDHVTSEAVKAYEQQGAAAGWLHHDHRSTT